MSVVRQTYGGPGFTVALVSKAGGQWSDGYTTEGDYDVTKSYEGLVAHPLLYDRDKNTLYTDGEVVSGPAAPKDPSKSYEGPGREYVFVGEGGDLFCGGLALNLPQ
jgi:hypothetical protein